MIELRDYWIDGYMFVVGSYYGDSPVDEWEEVEELYADAEDDPYLEVEVEVDDEARQVYLFVQDHE